MTHAEGNGHVLLDFAGWKNCGGKSIKTKNIRSATPRGFAKAVFIANALKENE